MQAFLQSAFMQALSHSLIASIWQMGLLWLATIILVKSFKFSTAIKFNIAFFAQSAGFLIFIYTFIITYNNPASTGLINISSGNENISLINTVLNDILPYMAAMYLMILFCKLISLAFVYRSAKGLSKYHLSKIPANYRIFVQKMEGNFSIKKKVKIFLSGEITCPLTLGFLKPVILIPLAAVNHLTTEQMEAVILHELAHIKRADYFLFVIQNLIEKVFFFNVFTLLIGHIIERERENACDDWVLQFRYNSMYYAEALFKLGRLKTLSLPAMHLTGKKESLLLARIKRLLHHTQKKQSFNFQPVLLGLFSLFIMAGILFSFTVKPLQKKEFAKKEETIKLSEPTSPSIIITKKPSPKTVGLNKEIPGKKPVAKNTTAEAGLETQQQLQELQEIKLKDLQQKSVDEQIKQALQQKYLLQVSQSFDSLKNNYPQYLEALNTKLDITPQQIQKAISYQNFKTLESMLAASGNKISITESKDSKGSYKKQLTIQATDKNGNKHIYVVDVELYQ